MVATIDFKCMACGARLSVKPELAGKKGQCPKCGAYIPVPLATLQPFADPEPVSDPAAKALYEPMIQRVHVIDLKMPFGSMVRFIFKWTFAAGPTMIALWLIYLATNVVLVMLKSALFDR